MALIWQRVSVFPNIQAHVDHSMDFIDHFWYDDLIWTAWLPAFVVVVVCVLSTPINGISARNQAHGPLSSAAENQNGRIVRLFLWFSFLAGRKN